MSDRPEARTAPRPSEESRVVRGRVIIRGTNSPVDGVVAQVSMIAADGQQSSLGSSPVERGHFEIVYSVAGAVDGAQSRTINVTILAPASGSEASVLGRSETRSAAAPSEYFVIAIDAEGLAKQGGVEALAAAKQSADATVAAGAVKLGQDMAVERHEKIVAERRKSVDTLRERELNREQQLRDRVIEQVTGAKRESAVWKRMVPPGADVETIARPYQSDALAGTIADILGAQGARTYLVLSDTERQALGEPPDPAKVESLLRKRGKGSIEREDALAICRPDPADIPASPPSDTDPSPGESTGESADAKVNELVRAISSPDELVVEGPMGAGGVSERVLKLTLAKGPADVPAYYDFHRLELAFEHIWEDARADGYIERAMALHRIAEDFGGNPDAALRSSEAPMRALAREARIAVAAAAGASGNNGEAGVVAHDLSLAMNQPGYQARFNPDVASTDTLPPSTLPLLDSFIDDADRSLDPSGRINGSGYPFTVFAAGSVNFGLLVTYQQCFEPRDYQVGRLVGTRTLGPKETYSFTTRQVIKTSYNRKQIEANQQLRRDDSEQSYRDEAQIVNRAQTKTNFSLTTSGGFDLGPLGEGDATTTLGRDAESGSHETKRAQRSAVQKAAQEQRSEQRMEIESASSMETETVEKREIVNPNDELALTCVFYELQRRYRVSEKLHRVTPIILVAQKVPRPEEINEAWILHHDWILRRFLPDDSFQSALTYLATRAAGDRVVLNELLTHMNGLRANVAELKRQIVSVRAQADRQLQVIQNYVRKTSEIIANDDGEGWLEGAWETVAGQDEGSRESIRVLEEAARERYEKAVRDEQDLRTRMDSEATALQVATDAYVSALAEDSNRRVEVNRLITHIRAYILHYMQGIWSYEHPDQRFFRHHVMTAPRLAPLSRTYQLHPVSGWPVGVTPEPGKRCYRVSFTTAVDPDVESEGARATLAEIADLDRMLGFKGNYIMYPMKESNGLTDYMMTPYLDATLGVRDPDEVGNWTLEEFTDYVGCLKSKLSDSEFAEIEPVLEAQRKKLLTSAFRNGEHVVIPSNSLYMQMLVDSGKALEGFKEAHRLMDVMKVKAEVRAAELDNLRRAKLVLNNQLDDPNVESVKNVYYHGATPPHDGDE